MKTFALSALSAVAYAASDKDHAARVAELNAGNPHATFSVEAISPHHKGGCYRAPSSLSTDEGALSFTADELRAAEGAVAIDWREHGAVGPVQQQHPFGTCWAFSMTAVTEAVNVIQGGNAFEKLSEQMTVSCVPAAATGDNSDVLWSWALANTGGKYQTEAVYAYNRTCNSYRETQVSNAATADAADAAASDDVALCSLTPFYRHTHTRSLVRALFLSLSLSLQLAPDGKPDGYTKQCDFKHPAPAGPCPPCGPECRADGTPPCRLPETRSAGFSKASVQGWGFIAPHGRRRLGTESAAAVAAADSGPNDVTRMVAALLKYGPAQIGIDASCVIGYTGGIITNCTRTVADQDHAVAIVGAGTDAASGVDYWLVRNSWDKTFGEDGYFRMQRDTMQMGIFGGYFACFNKDCTVDP